MSSRAADTWDPVVSSAPRRFPEVTEKLVSAASLPERPSGQSPAEILQTVACLLKQFLRIGEGVRCPLCSRIHIVQRSDRILQHRFGASYRFLETVDGFLIISQVVSHVLNGVHQICICGIEILRHLVRPPSGSAWKSHQKQLLRRYR